MKRSTLHSVLFSSAVCMLVSCTTGAPKVDVGWLGESVSTPQNDTVINEAGGALPELSALPAAPHKADAGTSGPGFWAQMQKQPEPHGDAPLATPTPQQPQAVAAQTSATRTYTVKQGDTMSSIAARYGVSTSSLISLNGMTANPHALRIGQVLRIPGPAATMPAPGSMAPARSTASYRTYTVAAGDTLSGIAARYGTSVSAIMSVNGFTPDAANRLRIGQTIKLP